jgi:hypothetical protein
MRLSLTVLGVLLAASAAQAQQVQELQVSGHAGWGGRVSRGDWAPVLVDLDSRGKKDLDLVIAVTWAANFAHQNVENPSLEGVIGRTGPVHQVALTLPAKSRKRISLSVLTPDTDRLSVWAFALDARNGKTLARFELVVQPIEPHKRIVAVVGLARPDGLEGGGIEVANLQADELPEEWQAYGALEALVWIDGRATEIRSSAQVDALKQWISSGGKFCVARANAIDLAGTAIAELLPVRLGSIRQMESLGGGRFPEGPEGKAAVLECVVRQGAVRADREGIPLVVESSRDAGRILFLAADPSREPFSGWSGAGPFWRWLLRIPAPQPPSRPEDQTAPLAIGSVSLADQAGRFPDVAAPEIGGLFLLIVLYLIVVGPLDYLLLRWLRKLEYTWFTFPAYVALFTLFILLVGGAFIQRAAHQREIAVVDYYPETGFVRHRALSAVLAPADVIYRAGDAQPLSSNFVKNDLSSDSSEKFNDIRILRAPERSVENWLLLRNWTALALADRCSVSPSPLTYAITMQDNVEIRLTLKNATGETFENSSLVTPRGAYWIGSIPPGETQASGIRTSPTLEAFVEKEGQRPVRQARPQYNYGRFDNAPSGSATEQQINPPIRKALVGLSFPTGSTADLEALTGLARGLQAKRWIDAGGTILLVWPQRTDAIVHYDPKPARHTSVTLHRFFQGPPP